MNKLVKIISVVGVPLMILGMFGEIVSGIWLAFLRDWSKIVLGIILVFLSTNIIGLVLMPSLLLGGPAAYFAEKGKTIGFLLFGSLSSIYTLGVVTLWCSGVLFLFVGDSTPRNIIPRLIWSYGIATGPWAYVASHDQGDGLEGFASSVATFLAELAYLAIMMLVLITSLKFVELVKIFAAFMLVAMVFQITAGLFILKSRGHAGLRNTGGE